MSTETGEAPVAQGRDARKSISLTLPRWIVNGILAPLFVGLVLGFAAWMTAIHRASATSSERWREVQRELAAEKESREALEKRVDRRLERIEDKLDKALERKP